MSEVAQAKAPLGLYVHWPYCAKICPYCDFNVFRDRGRKDEQAALFAAIADDLRAQRELTGDRRLVSIFLGGGTPSLMAPETVAAILEAVDAAWPLLPGTREIDLPQGSLFSILGLSPLSGLSIGNVRYPLADFSLPFGSSRTISNVAEGPIRLSLASGRAILIARPYDLSGA